MRVTVVSDPPARISADVFVLGFFEDVRPPRGVAGQVDWLAGGALSKLIISRRLTGRVAETALLSVPTFATPRVLCVGLGRVSNFTYLVAHQIAVGLRQVVTAMKARGAAIELFGAQACGLDSVILARTIVKAWYQDEAPNTDAIELTFVAPKGSQPQQIEQRIRDMGA